MHGRSIYITRPTDEVMLPIYHEYSVEELFKIDNKKVIKEANISQQITFCTIVYSNNNKILNGFYNEYSIPHVSIYFDDQSNERCLIKKILQLLHSIATEYVIISDCDTMLATYPSQLIRSFRSYNCEIVHAIKSIESHNGLAWSSFEHNLYGPGVHLDNQLMAKTNYLKEILIDIDKYVNEDYIYSYGLRRHFRLKYPNAKLDVNGLIFEQYSCLY